MVDNAFRKKMIICTFITDDRRGSFKVLNLKKNGTIEVWEIEWGSRFNPRLQLEKTPHAFKRLDRT